MWISHMYTYGMLWNIYKNQFIHSGLSDSLQHPGLQHTMPPCPSPTSRVYSNSCPLSRWCHPTISSPVLRFSSCFQSFPALGSFQMSQFFISGDRSIGASASVLPMNIQGWFVWMESCNTKSSMLLLLNVTFLRVTTFKCVSAFSSFFFQLVFHDTPPVLCGHVCCLQVRVIISKAAGNTDAQVCVWTRAFGSLA